MKVEKKLMTLVATRGTKNGVEVTKRNYEYTTKNGTTRAKSSSKKSVWLEHKGKKVYLTGHQVVSMTSIGGGKTRYEWTPTRAYLRRFPDAQSASDEAFPLDFFNGLAESMRGHSVLSADRNEILTKAYAEANERDFDLGTFLAELPETIAYVGDIIVRLAKILIGIKKGLKNPSKFLKLMKTKPKELPQDLAALWLEYRYSIMPLVYSAEGMLKSLETPEAVFERIRNRESGEDDFEKVFTFGPYARYKVLFHIEQVARAQVYQILTPGQDSARRYLLSPTITAWELIPLSFVVNWFLGVGEFLLSLNCIPTQSRGHTYSVKTTYVADLVDLTAPVLLAKNNNNPDYTYRMISTCGPWRLKIDEYLRLSNPTFTNTISVGPDMNFKRYIDALALAMVLLRRSAN